MKDPKYVFVNRLGDSEWDILGCKRSYEWFALHYMVNAVRCQGKLTCERRDLLKKVSSFFKISHERYQAEIRRVLCDDQLSTIAEFVEGPNINDEWIQEGRSLFPSISREPPATVYKAYADELAQMFNETDDEESDGDSDDNSAIQPRKKIAMEFLAPVGNSSLPDDRKEAFIRELKRKWYLAKEDIEGPQAKHHVDLSSPQESQSTASESELSTMSTSQVTSADEPTIKLEVENNIPNPNEKEKNDLPEVIEVISEEETISVKSDLEEELLGSINDISLERLHYKEDEEGTRKRKASSDIAEPPFPAKVLAPSKTPIVAVTTQAVSSQPSYKYSTSNLNNAKTAFTSTSTAQKVIIVSSANSVSNSSILQRSLSSSGIKTASGEAVTPVLSTSCHVQPVSSSAIFKHKPKGVAIPSKSREPIVIRSQSIQLKSVPSVSSSINQVVNLEKIPIHGITTAAKVLTKSGGCDKSGTTVTGVTGGHVLVMNTSASSTVRNTVSVGQRFPVPVRAHLPQKQDTPSFQTTKIIQGTTANSKPVIVLQKGGPHMHSQRGVTLTTATKELVNKVLMGKNVSSLSRPLVSVQKAATMLKPGTNLPFSANQGNVIVLDLSQEQIGKNATLAEILQASGIISENTTITTATSTIMSADISNSSNINRPSVSSDQVSSNPVTNVPVESKTVCLPASTNLIVVTTAAPSPSFNTNNIVTASTSTVTSVQASTEIKEVDTKGWSAPHCLSAESQNLHFDLSFTIEASTAESVDDGSNNEEDNNEEDVNEEDDNDEDDNEEDNNEEDDIEKDDNEEDDNEDDDNEDDNERDDKEDDDNCDEDDKSLNQQEKINEESSSDSVTESDDETSEDNHDGDKNTSENSVRSDDSSEKEKFDQSDPVLVQSSSSCNIEIISSSDADASLDSFQMMQVDSIAELPSEDITFINEESQENSITAIVEEDPEKHEKSDELNSEGDTVMRYVRQGSSENTIFSITTEDVSDDTSVTELD